MKVDELLTIFKFQEIPFESYEIPDDDRIVLCFPAKSYRKCRVDMWKENYVEFEDANLLKAFYNFGTNNNDIAELIDVVFDSMSAVEWRMQ